MNEATAIKLNAEQRDELERQVRSQTIDVRVLPTKITERPISIHRKITASCLAEALPTPMAMFGKSFGWIPFPFKNRNYEQLNCNFRR